MANCNDITAGLPLGCEKIPGGLKKVALTRLPTGITSVDDYITFDVDGMVDGFTSALTFHLYETEELSSSVLENMADSGNRAGGYTQTANLVFGGLDNNKRTVIDNLINTRFLLVAYFQNGLIKLYGAESGMYMSNIDITSGVALSDFSGYTLEAKANSHVSAYVVNDGVITLA